VQRRLVLGLIFIFIFCTNLTKKEINIKRKDNIKKTMKRNNLEFLRNEKKQVFDSRRADLMTRQSHNPYLTEVIADYDNLQTRQKQTDADLADALRIIETHIADLQQSNNDETQKDVADKLQDDLMHIRNKLFSIG
jgi:hypothetical protein